MFSHEQNWIMRQIKAIADTIAAIIFRKAEISYEIQDETNHTETDILFLRLNKMLDDGDINGAEDALFEQLNPTDINYLLLAVDFYQRLNEKSDEELECDGFSRDEVKDGISEIMEIYGIMPAS